MFRVELKEGTDVFTADGKEVGKLNRFILDPSTNDVTHIVVQKGWLLPEDKVVPFEMVREATEDKIVLNDNLDDFNNLPPFEESHFIRATDEGGSNATRQTGDYPTYQSAQAYYWYPPYGYLGYPAYGLRYAPWPPVETQQNIPENTVPIHEGTDVISSDGKHVGDVERLFVEPEANKASHFLISQGLLFKDHKLVPASWVKSATEDKVQLKVSSKVLESLPDYQG